MHPLRQVTFGLILTVGLAGSTLTGCVERIVEPEDVFSDVHRGETYSPASHMIDDWYAVEAIDAQTYAINEPKSSQYNTSYLLVGETRALMFDAGSGERPAGSRSMREVIKHYAGNKPISLLLSHFHYDHIHDAAAFDGVTLIDRPGIRATIKEGIYTIGPLESHGMDWRSIKVAQLVADGEVLDLGGRTVEVLNLPGHTTESVVLFDRHRNQVFTGDFVYRHLGGIIAFASGSDLTAYRENSTRLLQLTNADTSFFGAHGIPRFDRDWVALFDHELDKIVTGAATYRYAAHYLAPGIPWRVYQNGDLYIYTTPLADPPIFWSKWAGLLVVTMGLLFLYLLYRIMVPRF